MSTLKLWRVLIRLGLLIGLVGLSVIALQPDHHVRAEEAARPPVQDDYPVVTEPPPFEGYPPGEVTEDPGPYPVVTDETSPDETATLTPTATEQTITPPTPQDTPTPDLSRTAEMGDARTGTPGTPGTPTLTGTPSPTVQQTITPTEIALTGTPESGGAGGFEMNWGLFWIGFSIPLVGASGVVLYLLDRRPELFRPKRK